MRVGLQPGQLHKPKRPGTLAAPSATHFLHRRALLAVLWSHPGDPDATGHRGAFPCHNPFSLASASFACCPSNAALSHALPQPFPPRCLAKATPCIPHPLLSPHSLSPPLEPHLYLHFCLQPCLPAPLCFSTAYCSIRKGLLNSHSPFPHHVFTA